MAGCDRQVSLVYHFQHLDPIIIPIPAHPARVGDRERKQVRGIDPNCIIPVDNNCMEDTH